MMGLTLGQRLEMQRKVWKEFCGPNDFDAIAAMVDYDLMLTEAGAFDPALPADTRPTRSELLLCGIHDICADQLVFCNVAREDDPAPYEPSDEEIRELCAAMGFRHAAVGLTLWQAAKAALIAGYGKVR